MLQRFIQEFLTYCRLADFSDRSIQALTARLNEFQSFLKVRNIRSVKKITYLDLVAFVADFNSPSIHVRKSRVWTLRQFYHFLTLKLGVKSTFDRYQCHLVPASPICHVLLRYILLCFI